MSFLIGERQQFVAIPLSIFDQIALKPVARTHRVHDGTLPWFVVNSAFDQGDVGAKTVGVNLHKPNLTDGAGYPGAAVHTRTRIWREISGHIPPSGTPMVRFYTRPRIKTLRAPCTTGNTIWDACTSGTSRFDRERCAILESREVKRSVVSSQHCEVERRPLTHHTLSQIRPWCKWMSSRQIGRPRPVPRGRPTTDSSTWRNFSNTPLTSSGGIPRPCRPLRRSRRHRQGSPRHQVCPAR